MSKARNGRMKNNVEKKDYLTVPKSQARDKLQAQIDEAEEIAKLKISNEDEFKRAKDAMDSWYDFTKESLLRLFTTDRMEQEFAWSVRVFGGSYSFHDRVEKFHDHLSTYLNTLKSVLRRVDLYDEYVAPEGVSMKREEKSINKKDVFVAYGRNEQLRRSMFEFLRALGLNPREWSQAIAATEKASPYIGEILDAAFQLAQAVVVLLSGEDEARLLVQFQKTEDPGYEKELTPQPRPNVLFEAGMAMGRTEKRTVLVQIGPLRSWSDIAGRHVTYLDDTTEKRHELAIKLENAGCDVDLSGQDWMKVGDFRNV